MKSYFESNFELINYYQKLYRHGVDVSEVISKVEKNEEINLDIQDISRFQIFIDSCLFLWNTEKFEKEYKNNFEYKQFFEDMNQKQETKEHIKYLDEVLFHGNYKYFSGFYMSLDNEEVRPWDQVKKVRNGLAHMQYGNYVSAENGPLYIFYLYNKDKGKMKAEGIVIPYFFHEFVNRYYSNYTNMGIPLKHTWFSFTKNKREIYFNTVKYIQGVKYVGEPKNHPMNRFTFEQRRSETFYNYLESNKEIFEHTLIDISNSLSSEVIEGFFDNSSNAEVSRKYKLFYDTDTELSNFLVHINQLNGMIYNYSLRRNISAESPENKEQVNLDIIKGLKELYEDQDTSYTFRHLFNLLLLMNLVQFVQDEYIPDINFRKVSFYLVTPISINYENMCFKINERIIEHSIPSEEAANVCNDYYIDKIRNALMHGHISVKEESNDDLSFIFSDIYKGRNEQIGIKSSSIPEFINTILEENSIKLRV